MDGSLTGWYGGVRKQDVATLERPSWNIAELIPHPLVPLYSTGTRVLVRTSKLNIFQGGKPLCPLALRSVLFCGGGGGGWSGVSCTLKHPNPFVAPSYFQPCDADLVKIKMK